MTLDSRVSCFPNATGTQPSNDRSLGDFISGIKNGEWHPDIERLRKLSTAGNGEAFRRQKKQLPAITPHGIFATRKDDALQTHSGFVCIDLDQVADLSIVRARLEALDCVAACFLSPSGEGLKLLVPVSPVPTNKEEHECAFAAVAAQIKQHVPAECFDDGVGRDASRLCFVSFDPRAVCKDSWAAVGWSAPTPAAVAANRTPREKPLSARKVAEILSAIPTAPPYDLWLRIISATLEALGSDTETAARLLNEWSPEQTRGEYERKLRSPLVEITRGTLILHARENGWVGSTNDEPDCYYEGARNRYWLQNDRSGWEPTDRGSVAMHLRMAGITARPAKGQIASAQDEVFARYQRSCGVAYAAPLAGYHAGVHMVKGQRILVTDSPNLIDPAQGEWPLLSKFFAPLFGEQLDWFFGWLQVAAQGARGINRRPGQTLVLVGSRNSGKSLVQDVITACLGGREARPYRYMCGATDFNADLFRAEHLLMEDEAATRDLRTRQHFGAFIKGMTVNQGQSCHGKNKDAIELNPFWRLSISMNSEAEHLAVLPPIDDGLQDKLIILRVNPAEVPLPHAERGERWAAIFAELPAFLHWLFNEHQIAPGHRCTRMGITYFHDAQTLADLGELAPEIHLLGLIDLCIFAKHAERKPWAGTAAQLQSELCEFSPVQSEARSLLRWTNACGTYLGRLEGAKSQGRIEGHRTNAARRWIIQPPPVTP